jgi:hypothetical protein
MTLIKMVVQSLKGVRETKIEDRYNKLHAKDLHDSLTENCFIELYNLDLFSGRFEVIKNFICRLIEKVD